MSKVPIAIPAVPNEAYDDASTAGVNEARPRRPDLRADTEAIAIIPKETAAS